MFNKTIKKECQKRVKTLRMFDRMLKQEGEAIANALAADFNKPRYESFATEISFIRAEIGHISKHLYSWAKGKKKPTPKALWPATSWIVPQPLGKVLVFAPWNYPFQLSVGPAIAAYAAGNQVVLKPSSQTPETSKIIQKLISAVFDPEDINVILGDREESNRLLGLEWDLIFFTGSYNIGKMIMQKAGERMIPCILELGGKSPCVVTPEADLAAAAKRIVWGKFVNAGQTCVAPDYVLAHQSIQEPLIEAIKEEIEKQYADLEQIGFPTIISEKNFNRIKSLMVEDEVIYGGVFEDASRKIKPTLLKPKSWDSPVMEGEIFGPLLPILSWETEDDIKDHIAHSPQPLAFYYFGNKEKGSYFMNQIQFGGGCINDVLIHLANDHIPFGGVGRSGHGEYHGKFGFDAFVHKKGIIVRGKMDIPVRYRPHSEMDLKLTNQLMIKG